MLHTQISHTHALTYHVWFLLSVTHIPFEYLDRELQHFRDQRKRDSELQESDLHFKPFPETNQSFPHGKHPMVQILKHTCTNTVNMYTLTMATCVQPH